VPEAEVGLIACFWRSEIFRGLIHVVSVQPPCSKGAQGTFKLEPVGDPLDDRLGLFDAPPSSRSCPGDFWQAKVIPPNLFALALCYYKLEGGGSTISSSALRREPANQEYDSPKGDSLLAATQTRKGAPDHVRLQPSTRQVPPRSRG
jgi:hypothetical protein